MKLRHLCLILCLLSCATLLLTNCGGGATTTIATGTSTVLVTPQPAAIPAGSTVTFTSTVSSGTNSPNWFLQSYAYANLGSPTAQAGGSTFVYTAPATPPVYTGAAGSTTAGTVTLQASEGLGPLTSTTFVITTPAVAVSLSPSTANVALGATQTFVGYALGNVNNAVTAQVNGVTGGVAATGTIAATPQAST
jgi:hypothetical protein